MKDGWAPRVSDSGGLGGREQRILARSQGMRAQGPHFENRRSIAKLLYEGPKVDLGKRTVENQKGSGEEGFLEDNSEMGSSPFEEV